MFFLGRAGGGGWSVGDGGPGWGWSVGWGITVCLRGQANEIISDSAGHLCFPRHKWPWHLAQRWLWRTGSSFWTILGCSSQADKRCCRQPWSNVWRQNHTTQTLHNTHVVPVGPKNTVANCTQTQITVFNELWGLPWFQLPEVSQHVQIFNGKFQKEKLHQFKKTQPNKYQFILCVKGKKRKRVANRSSLGLGPLTCNVIGDRKSSAEKLPGYLHFACVSARMKRYLAGKRQNQRMGLVPCHCHLCTTGLGNTSLTC